MNVQELHDLLHNIIDEGNGDMTVEIQAMTGRLSGGSNAQVQGVAYGFDWHMNKVIINPAETLLGAAYAEKRRESARKAGERSAECSGVKK